MPVWRVTGGDVRLHGWAVFRTTHEPWSSRDFVDTLTKAMQSPDVTSAQEIICRICLQLRGTSNCQPTGKAMLLPMKRQETFTESTARSPTAYIVDSLAFTSWAKNASMAIQYIQPG